MIKITLIIASLFSGSMGLAQKDLNINYQLRGHIYASSSVEDTAALGGFGGSDNIPKSLRNGMFPETGFFLKVDTLSQATVSGKFNGYHLFLVNKLDSVVKLTASDSRLSIIAQVYIDQKWQAIEYLPSSWCGNSYHTVSVRPNEYWTFNVPKFTGKIKTRLRYRLAIGKNENQYLYSNEIFTRINKKQLVFKEGHDSAGLMDPYSD